MQWRRGAESAFITSGIDANAAMNRKMQVMHSNHRHHMAATPRTQALHESYGSGDYALKRKEQLEYLHNERENVGDMSEIDAPLNADMHKNGLKDKQHFEMLHQQIMSDFEAAKGDKSKRAAFKQRLTMLCDEGRSHPQYWALKTELDDLDGGEDDSDTLQAFDNDGGMPSALDGGF